MNSESSDRPRVLVAGVGNIFLSDDAFGVEVVQRLSRRPLPDCVRVIDFGIRGLDLAYALLDGYETVILVDAAPRGGAPGTLYVLEPELDHHHSPAEGVSLMEAHNMDPARVFSLVTALGGHVERVMVVGCEPQPTTSDDDMPLQMSAAVQSAVDPAVALVESLVARLLAGEECRPGV